MNSASSFPPIKIKLNSELKSGQLQAASRVRAALTAAALRARLPRLAELRLACLDTAWVLALFLDSRFNAREVD
jgi:hypothetical protein